MRLIDADALVERWKRIASISWNDTAVTSWSQAYVEIISEIEEEPTFEAEPKWISCSQVLPEEEGVYLATFKNTYSHFVDTVWFDYDGFFVKSNATVIAWMPLPVPYKG